MLFIVVVFVWFLSVIVVLSANVVYLINCFVDCRKYHFTRIILLKLHALNLNKCAVIRAHITLVYACPPACLRAYSYVLDKQGASVCAREKKG